MDACFDIVTVKLAFGGKISSLLVTFTVTGVLLGVGLSSSFAMTALLGLDVGCIEMSEERERFASDVSKGGYVVPDEARSRITKRWKRHKPVMTAM